MVVDKVLDEVGDKGREGWTGWRGSKKREFVAFSLMVVELWAGMRLIRREFINDSSKEEFRGGRA
jgi:hypothetical protein